MRHGFPRRPGLPAAALALALPLGLSTACTRDRVASDDASPPGSTTETVASSPAPAASPASAPTRLVLGGAAPPTSAATPPPGVAVEGLACSPGKDSISCTADAKEVLTCAGGQWRKLESCRGSGRCTGVGSSLTCDTGTPQPGDSCAPATAQPVCRTAHEALVCQGTQWMVSPCAPGHICSPAVGKARAGCK